MATAIEDSEPLMPPKVNAQKKSPILPLRPKRDCTRYIEQVESLKPYLSPEREAYLQENAKL